jgi:hypothetical protein
MPITQDFLDGSATETFASAADIDTYFTKNHNQGFIEWFNANVARKGNWGSVPNHSPLGFANSPDIQDAFNLLWSTETISVIFSSGQVSMLQFLALQSIILNETGGTLVPVSEKVGMQGHPGIAYAFDAISGLKLSYNTLAGNKTCFTLFNDSGYNDAFRSLPLGDQLENTTNQAWNGTTYPSGVPTSTDASVTGYVLEADFFKFRGRGLIQTTGRTNYKKLIDYVLAYSGENTVVTKVKTGWGTATSDTDVIATASTNEEWDDLFQNSGYLVPAKAIDLHNQGGGDYLGNVDATSPATASASIRHVGLRISGAGSYADLFLARVTQIIEAM